MLRSAAIIPQKAAVSVTWDNLEGKPAAFAPAAHSHAWADITDKPSMFAPSAHTHAYSALTGIPTSFPPSTHTHSYNDLTDKPAIPSAGNALLGTVTLSESALVAINAGVRRITITTPAAWGVTAGQNLLLFPVSLPGGGYATHDVIATAANTIQVGITAPLLAIGASYTIQARLVRVNT